ncbi:MAG: hypothetical protein PVG65_00080 [Candidatus Thorarchaeota archaeon]|jgi:hypothetical protein
MSIIRKKLKNPCYLCNGKKRKKCKICHGTGMFEDEINYFIDKKKKIAISGDTLK